MSFAKRSNYLIIIIMAIIEKIFLNEKFDMNNLNELSLDDLDIASHLLYEKLKYDKFYIKNSSHVANLGKLPYLNNTQYLEAIEQYKKYPSLYGVMFFNYELQFCKTDDKISFIKSYPESNIITRGYKINTIFGRFGIIDFLQSTPYLDFIKKILMNIDQFDEKYNEIEKEFIDYSNINIEIPSDDLFLLLKYNFIELCCNINIRLHKKLNLEKHMIDLLSKIINRENFTKCSEYLQLRLAVAQYNRDNTNVEYFTKIYNLQIKNFLDTKTYDAFYDITILLNNNNKHKELAEFIKNNFDVVNAMQNTLLGKNFIPILHKLATLNISQELSDIIYKNYSNEITVCVAEYNNIKFVNQRVNSSSRLLYDANNDSVCTVCLDKIIDDELVVLCITCKKYIGHDICIRDFFKFYMKCSHCAT